MSATRLRACRHLCVLTRLILNEQYSLDFELAHRTPLLLSDNTYKHLEHARWSTWFPESNMDKKGTASCMALNGAKARHSSMVDQVHADAKNPYLLQHATNFQSQFLQVRSSNLDIRSWNLKQVPSTPDRCGRLEICLLNVQEIRG